METMYPTLKRPKRKLCYHTNSNSPSKKWTGALTPTLGDIDKLFDDLDSPSVVDDDLMPPSPLLQTFNNERQTEVPAVPQKGQTLEKLLGSHMGPKGDILRPATRSPSPRLDIDLDFQFKAHGSMKTSSPIEENMAVEQDAEVDKEKDRAVSPIVFACEDEEEEEEEHLSSQKPQSKKHVTKEDDFDLESPPSRVSLNKPKMSCHKQESEAPSKASHPVKGTSSSKTQTQTHVSKGKPERQEKSEAHIPAVGQDLKLAASDKKSGSDHKRPSAEVSTRDGKDMTTFLKKLREAGLSKPACSRKSQLPVKVPTPPPEPEDDFLILEDEPPLWISIPTKSATSKKPSGKLSSDKDGPTDEGAKESPKSGKENAKTGRAKSSKWGRKVTQESDERKEAVKEPRKEHNGAEEQDPASELDSETAKSEAKSDFSDGKDEEQETPPASDGANDDHVSGKRKPIGQRRESSSEETEAAGDLPAARKQGKKKKNEEPTTTTRSPVKAKKEKALKRRKQSASASNQNTNKVKEKSRKTTGKERATEEEGEQQDEDLDEGSSPLDLSHRSLSRGDQVFPRVYHPVSTGVTPAPTSPRRPGEQLRTAESAKRIRKPPGDWWTVDGLTEEAKKISSKPQQSPLKESKKKSKRSGGLKLGTPKNGNAAVSSKPAEGAAVPPLKGKPLSAPKTVKRSLATFKDIFSSAAETPTVASSRRAGQKKKRKVTATNRSVPDKSAEGVLSLHSVELDSAPRYDSPQDDKCEQEETSTPFRSGPVSMVELQEYKEHDTMRDQVFPRVYHPVSTGVTPAPTSPRRPGEQLRTVESAKRIRKPPGDWWTVDGLTEEAKKISSKPQQSPLKESKKKSKRSGGLKLGTPKNGNAAVSSKPAEGAAVPPLKGKPLSAPKTVKRSLAPFKDIFSSAAETPTVASSRRAGQKKKLKVTATNRSVSEKSAEGVLSLHSVELNSAPRYDSPQDDKCEQEETSTPFRSGPVSMVELQEYKEHDTMTPPSSSADDALCASDLCAPPLKPLALQPKDEANLTEWLKSLWAVSVDEGTEVTPEHFDWYFYQGGAMGFMVDLNSGTICNGKILLGSYMKKPLWVDHSATSVFNLLTSSVSVTVNGSRSSFNPGQSFMVPCGHAYSIQNISAQPAVLYFTRILTQSLD